MSSTKNLELVASFAGSVFTSDNDGNPVFTTAERHVRKTAKSAERIVSFQKPVLAVSNLQYWIKRGEALVEVVTEHVTKQKNEDGSVTETKRISNALNDVVEEHLNDIAEDASEAYLSKGNTPDYFAAFIYGVSADRETEKSVLKKIDSIRSEIGSIVFSMAGEWNDDVARSLGVTDKEAAIAKQANLIGSLAQLLAKANELNAAKAKRESKKAKV
jgi:hypothetical protein